MRRQPEYRFRLFLSIDLIGSTALKSNASHKGTTRSGETWVKQINHFYSDFPKSFLQQYSNVCKAFDVEQYKIRAPRLWKTLGDELIFCVRVVNLQHLKILTLAFIKSLKNYGLYLDERRRPLDVKGSAWICSFPEPNITVKVSSHNTASIADFDQLTDEDAESEADEFPHRFDFLGRHVDAGFRLSKFAKHEGLSITAELAYLLGLCCKDDVGIFEFEYRGREEIKGIIGDQLYPVFLIDVERNNARKLSRSLEWGMQGRSFLPGHQIVTFLEAFFDQESMELPTVSRESDTREFVAPFNFRDYIDRWNEDNKARDEALKAADREAEQADIVVTVDNDVVAGANELGTAFDSAVTNAEHRPNSLSSKSQNLDDGSLNKPEN